MPKVSIIVPSYNREHLIRDTLDSIKKQIYSAWECIIIDDGSTDGTFSVIKQYCEEDERFQMFVRPESKPKGPSSCRNYGMEKATGDYVIFLDSDDLLAPFCLEARLRAFETNRNCDFLVFQMERFKERPDMTLR